MRQHIIDFIFFFSSKNWSLLINFVINLFFILTYLLQIDEWIFGKIRRLLLNLSGCSFLLHLYKSVLIKIRNVHMIIFHLHWVIQRILLSHQNFTIQNSFNLLLIRLFFGAWRNLLSFISVIRLISLLILFWIPEFFLLIESWLS
jgi:hypothetical protein